MDWLRRAILEAWAMALLAIVVGFLGPFGTYTRAPIVDRVGDWAALLIGAYVLVRPGIWVLQRVASHTSLPPGRLTLWGVVATSVPLAMIWRAVGQNAYRALDGYAELLPFALLCALVVLGVTHWAEAAGLRFADPSARSTQEATGRDPATDRALHAPADIAHADPIAIPWPRPDIAQPSQSAQPSLPEGDPVPRLLARLDPGFPRPVLALQSEDHYVRVHGATGSQLILMRLRDAIAEMDGTAGEQVHRGWWIARDGVAGMTRAGRTWHLRLSNGVLAPVARESVSRLRRSGFLDERAGEPA